MSALDDFYVPAYSVVLNGKVQPRWVQDIISVTFHNSLKDVDSVDLQVNNWDPGEPAHGPGRAGSIPLPQYQYVRPLAGELELWMGYYRQGQDNLQQMMVGEISSMAPNFPASGGSTLTVRALSFLHQFRIQQQTMQFHNRTDSQIAQKIVNEINKEAQAKFAKIKIQMLDSEVNDNIPEKWRDSPGHFSRCTISIPSYF